MKLALFDLDNTLLTGDSDFEWAQFLIAQGVLDRGLVSEMGRLGLLGVDLPKELGGLGVDDLHVRASIRTRTR